IVESPSKVKTIKKILGNDFIIKASVGHIKNLPENRLGVDIENDFQPEYELIKGKEKIVKELKEASKKAEKVFLSLDPDREGEAIAWHIAEEIDEHNRNIFRVTFSEITKKAVLEAFKHAGSINMNLVQSQQARRVLDRLFGYKLSPLLWKKIKRGLSAGRVQSVALRLIVEREKEIEAFKPQEYWSITVELEASSPPPFSAKLLKIKGKKAVIKNKEEADALLRAIEGSTYVVEKIEKKSRKRSPSPPFTTSTLQQEASRKLGFSAKRTMLIAQKLYEGVELGSEGPIGLITYMRTDSVRVAKEAEEEARSYISEKIGKDFVPKRPNRYKSKKSAQEAHEAIRPTSVFRTPDSIKEFLTQEQYKLYNLIWKRFVASQMAPASLEVTSVDIRAGEEYLFRASGSVIKFPGFMSLYTESIDEKEEKKEDLLPPLSEGEVLKFINIEANQHFTQPPPRYTEASLVKELDAKGIGRPSTYAHIISTLKERRYVEVFERKFKPSELGVLVCRLLIDKFPDLMDVGFTAKMEERLDSIEVGKFKWSDVVRDFYIPFDKELNEALSSKERIKIEDIPTDEVCEKCGAPMVIKWGYYGRFLACSAYPKCKNARSLKSDGDGDGEEIKIDQKCPTCGRDMVIKRGRFGRFVACSSYPECKTTQPISTGVKCPIDGGDIVEKRTKKGRRFYGCSNYPSCNFVVWNRPVKKTCPKCNAPFLVIKKRKSGEQYVCINKDCDYSEEVEYSSKSS
ncbi:MAG: type I DNA topoisomerase, partial [Nitrospirae bacterium]